MSGRHVRGVWASVLNFRRSSSTRVVTWPCNGRNNQRWTANSNGSIRNAGSGLCLDVNQAGTANGSTVIIWGLPQPSNQTWVRA
ncbi:MAG TPA: ricin-type beta-trefoil lectin domain protein [Actinophytocola sp.]|uniref:ricin-type beta-trefoil lectin domain protein n=1 Tax=Actinophytocola sp. TaxID=1872138 RepID=UPI002DDD339F|nr:ricin-type beta-trefoil lectin domain protein [Actinophytocola sp.]HEV2778243.1 ricin-type beta-trefoil lectin domain protein [Actinophytocola sp.]